MDTGALTPAPPAATRRRWPKALAALAVVAAIAAGSATTTVWALHQFPDVPNSNPFHADIDWLVENDIASGFQDGTFKPTQAVTRQSMAAFLHRYNSEIELVAAPAKSFNNASSTTGTASCPEGKRSLAGGGRTTISDLMITDSYPIEGGWLVRWESEGNALRSGSVVAYVVCVPA